MTSQEAVGKKCKQVGPAKCDVCGVKKKDVVETKGFFFNHRECDSCAHKRFFLYDKNKSGKAE